MFKTFKYFNNIKYLTTSGLISALLICLSLLTSMIDISGNKFQIADGFFIAFCFVIKGPMLLVVGIVYSFLFDLISGGLVFIPLTILIHVLIFILSKAILLLEKPRINYLAIPFITGLTFLYFPFNYLIFNWEVALTGLISDFFQWIISIVIAEIFLIVFKKTAIKKLFDFQFSNIYNCLEKNVNSSQQLEQVD